MRRIKKVRKRVLAAVLAAAMIFTAPGMAAYAEAREAQTEDISESVTIQEDDVDIANGLEKTEKPEMDDSDTEKSETDDSDTEKSETDDSDTEKSETDDSDTEKLETDGSDTEKSEADDSDTKKPETDDSDTDEPENGNDDTEETKADAGETMDEPSDSTEIEDTEAAEQGDIGKAEANASELALNGDDIAPVSRLYVLGNEVVNGSVTSGDGWSYDKDSNTLTLENLTVTADDYPENVTKFLDLGANANGRCLLNVYLKGNNTINSISEDEFIFYRTYLALNITGDDNASLTLNGMVQSDIRLISGNINFTINTQGTIFINYGMSIDDGATVVFNCSYGEAWKNAYYSVLSQAAGGIFVKNNSTLEINSTNPSQQCNLIGYGPLTVEDSTLTLKNVYATGVGTYLVNPWSGSVGANDTITIKNSTINLDTVEGLRGYSIDIADSTINTVEKTALALRSLGGDVTLAGTELNGLILESGTSNKFTVIGKANRPSDLKLVDGGILTVPEGASLNIPDSVTLTNNGTMRIHDKSSLTGAGTLEGTGSFQIDVTEDLISIPEGLACTGTDYADQIKLEETVTVCGIEFIADLDADEWTRSISPSEAVVDAGEYTVTFTKGGESISKTFTVAQSGTDLTSEGKVRTYNDGVATRDFTASDTITVIATPAAAEMATQKAARLWGNSFTSPTAGQMALFVNGVQVSEPVNVDENGTYTMTASASDVLMLGHVEPNGTAISLTAKFVGNSDMADAVAAVEINIFAAVKVNSYGTTAYYDTFDDAWMAADSAGTATVTLLTDVTEKYILPVLSGKKFTLNGGSHTFSIIGINVDGGQMDIIGGTFEMRDSLMVSSGTVRLSGGKFISTGGEEVIFCAPGSNLTVGDLLLNHVSTEPDATHCAYFTEEGKPLTDVLDQNKLTGIVTVQECKHDVSVCEYQHIDGTETHTLTCLACGYTEAEADCDYGIGYKHDETGHTQTCTLCGAEKTEAHNPAKLTAEVSGTVITVSGVCVCGYEEELGKVTLTIPQNLVYGETLDKQITWVTDLELFGGRLMVRLDSGLEIADSESCFLSELSWQGEQLSAGEHTLGVVVNITEDIINPKYVECSIPFTVARALLTPGIDTSAAAPTKVYDGTTDAPDGLVIKLEGIVDDDDVSAAAAFYEYDSVDAGARIIYANGITLSGDDAENYELYGDTAQIDGTIDKATGTLTVPETSFSKKYGETDFSLQCSSNGDGVISYTSDNENVVTVSADGMVQIKGTGEAALTVALAESRNYTAAAAQTVTITVEKGENAPNMPDSVINVLNSFLKVDDVPLPENWEWQAEDKDKALKEETAVEAVAVYTGTDKDNFETVTATIAVMSHKAGDDIFYTGEGEKEPTCTEAGVGHRECATCNIVVESGITVEALGHDYKDVVTKEPTTSEEGEMTYTCSRCGDSYTEPIPNKIPEGLWISGLTQSVPYTGSAVKPEGISVYHGNTLLREKAEYTISYKNNIKAGTAQVIVTGKGSYKGKATAEFTVEAVNLSTDTNVSAFIATVAETGKNLKPTVAVTWNGKKLKEKTDYTLTYEANIKTAYAEGYDVTINGKGNYTGTIVKKFLVVPKGTPLLSSAKVTGIKKSYEYQSGEMNAGQNEDTEELKAIPKGLEADLANITVKVGKTPLTQNDYTVRTESTDAVGTGYVVIEPTQTSAYAGEKRIPFNITGTNIKKCFITGLAKSYSYTGEPVMPEINVYTGKNGTGTQISSDAYTIQYSNYTNQGKATVTVTGIPEKGCSGSVKATYCIGKLNLTVEKAAGCITVTMPDDIKYAKGGTKPQPVITHSYNGTVRTLREGVDYTLKYSNNTTKYSSTSSGSTKKPTLKITGIGNYSGTITENFDIAVQDIGKLEITVADKAYNNKKKGSYYYSVPKVYDFDGKQLKSGKDYTVQYTNATGQTIGKNDTVENGTQIRVTVTAKDNGCYEGALSMTYLVRDVKDVKDISKTKNDKIAAQQYTGSCIEPEVKLYTLNGRTKTYLTEEDYEIIGYYNNIKRGTATVLIRGTGAYSGVKSITFKIASADNKLIWSGIF